MHFSRYEDSGIQRGGGGTGGRRSGLLRSLAKEQMRRESFERIT